MVYGRFLSGFLFLAGFSQVSDRFLAGFSQVSDRFLAGFWQVSDFCQVSGRILNCFW